MSSLPASDPTQLRTLRAAVHPRCVVCSPRHSPGLGLEFSVRPDGSVTAEFTAHEGWEGYAGQLHGGIIAALLDGAMANCLFARSCQAMTAELKVRYRHPVLIGLPLTVGARLTGSHGPLLLLEAELVQGGKSKAVAIGKFMTMPGPGQMDQRRSSS